MASFKFSCPHCGKHVEAEEEWEGLGAECPHCQNTIHIPQKFSIEGADVQGVPFKRSLPKQNGNIVDKIGNTSSKRFSAILMKGLFFILGTTFGGTVACTVFIWGGFHSTIVGVTSTSPTALKEEVHNVSFNTIEKDLPPGRPSEHLLNYAGKGDLEVVKYIIEKYRIDPNRPRTENGGTALYQAARNGYSDIVAYLLNKGADPNITNNSNVTPLFIAVSNGHEEVVKLLVEKGADPNIANNSNVTPLFVAASDGHEEVVKLLVEKGADPNIINSYGDSSHLAAAQRGHWEIVKLLIAKGANIHQQTKQKENLLHIAAKNDKKEVIKYLLEIGVPPWKQDFTGRMPHNYVRDPECQRLLKDAILYGELE